MGGGAVKKPWVVKLLTTLNSIMMNKETIIHTPVVVEVDEKSGFCFGVERAVKMAEEQLEKNADLVSLGDIVHNDAEIKRLEQLGMNTVSTGSVENINSQTVLFRAHGEPPSTYLSMKEAGKKVVDATCPVVLHLQKKVREIWQKAQNTESQIVIYGKKGHAEVVGLVGQANGEAIVVQGVDDVALINPAKTTYLLSQTTMGLDGLREIETRIREHLIPGVEVKLTKSICAQVANRVPHLRLFAARYDVILFVAGANSSNGKGLYKICKDVNPRTHFISKTEELKHEMLYPTPSRVGICGGTSTPRWLMEEVAEKVRELMAS